ncbi:MAG: hypothetical protein IKL09_01530, partial [Clostridia bacterium]|nr:hypothetical protein [Clostridia bacterium]
MVAKIIAVIMCIASFLPAEFSLFFSELELKYALYQGNYESPYIVRPLEDVTVNGESVDGYVIVIPDDGNALFVNAGETLNKELNKACGKKLTVTEAAAEKAFVIDAKLNDTDSFTLRVENGNVYITGSSTVG